MISINSQKQVIFLFDLFTNFFVEPAAPSSSAIEAPPAQAAPTQPPSAGTTASAPVNAPSTDIKTPDSEEKKKMHEEAKIRQQKEKEKLQANFFSEVFSLILLIFPF